jgi:aryl-alcohol dehydrogenase-like predicted oxidoreductase
MDKSKMIYRYLGNTGIRVSVLGYGNYLAEENEAAQKFSTDAIKKCLDYGVNFFDTAEGYAHGLAETQMGISLKELKVERKDIVVSTKIFFYGVG